ncbi:MAG: DUF4266 domain-containing protein [Thiotrichales bacterium]|nr:DUF4266 domain-containing protein [Thiotrichales bacterium]
MQKHLFYYLALSSMLVLNGCSSLSDLGAKPWEKGTLAKAEMQTNALDQAFDDHIYFSKEASSGGAGFAAGGCGCN